MNYYSFHIGDYRSATMHLSNEEDLAYRRLLDMYYDSESAIPLDTQWVSRRIRVDERLVLNVLEDMFERTENGWIHNRCEVELGKYKKIVERNRNNGLSGGRPKKGTKKTQSVSNGKPTKNQEPRTKHIKETIPLFAEFWSAYPKKVAKPAAEKAFKKLNANDEMLAQMIAAIQSCKHSESWKKQSGQFIPNPATWLNQRRWEDQLSDETQIPVWER